MKQRALRKKLQARRDAYDASKANKTGRKRPGSLNRHKQK